jgi:hypothetical protein
VGGASEAAPEQSDRQQCEPEVLDGAPSEPGDELEGVKRCARESACGRRQTSSHYERYTDE